MNSPIKAFSLIEIAISLLILGVIGSQFLPSLNQYRNLKQQSITDQKQKVILQSLGDYVRRYHHLPFPADENSGGKSVENLKIGQVPYQALGLDASYAKDGAHRIMTYAVNQVLSQTTSTQPIFHDDGMIESDQCFCYAYDPNPALHLVGRDLPDRDYLAIVLISHANSNTNSSDQANACRMKNKDGSGNFCITPCGDIISWVTRNNFLSTVANVTCKSLS